MAVRMGIGPAVIQAAELSDDDADFALTFSILMGGTATGVVWIASPAIAALFAKPELTPVLRAVGVSLLFTAVSSTSIGLLSRSMRFKEIAVLESIAYVIGSGVVGITAAYLGFGVWSLVAALLTNSGLKALIAALRAARRIRLRTSLAKRMQLIRFGSRFSLNSFLDYLVANLDTMIAGRLFTADLVGLYNRAFMIANLPMQMLVSSLTRVMYSTFSKLQTDRVRLASAELRLLAVVGSLTMTICLGMIPAAREIILVLLGPQWLGSVRVLQILLVAVPMNFMSHVLALTFDAVGELKRKTRIQSINLVVLGIALFLLYPLGIAGIAIAIALLEAFRFGFYVTENMKVFDVSYGAIGKVILESIVPGAIALLAIGVTSDILSSANPFLALSLEIAAGALIAFVFFWTHIPRRLGLPRSEEISIWVRRFLVDALERADG